MERDEATEGQLKVFISGTLSDLSKYRKEILEVVTRHGMIPLDPEVRASSKIAIENSSALLNTADIYIGIIGQQYNINHSQSNISFTELEYEYAANRRIPTIVFIKRDGSESLFSQDLLENPRLRFLKKAKPNSIITYFYSIGDLETKMSSALEYVAPSKKVGSFRDKVKDIALLSGKESQYMYQSLPSKGISTLEELSLKLLSMFPNTTLTGILQKISSPPNVNIYIVSFVSQKPKGLNGYYIVRIASKDLVVREKNLQKPVLASVLRKLAISLKAISRPYDEFQAIAYEISSNEIDKLQTLSNLLTREGWALIEARQKIKYLTTTLADFYLGSEALTTSTFDAFSLLNELLESRTHEIQTKSKALISEVWKGHSFCVSVGDKKQYFPNPFAYLSESSWSPGLSNWTCSITNVYGDLSTGNILCVLGTNPGIKLLNYNGFKSGGIPFFDLAKLEFDIILHALSMENFSHRKQLMNLLDFSMSGIKPEGNPDGHFAELVWSCIKPIRTQVKRLLGLNRDYDVTWWLCSVATGLNFYYKQDTRNSSFERVAALFYASYGLRQALSNLNLPIQIDDDSSFQMINDITLQHLGESLTTNGPNVNNIILSTELKESKSKMYPFDHDLWTELSRTYLLHLEKIESTLLSVILWCDKNPKNKFLLDLSSKISESLQEDRHKIINYNYKKQLDSQHLQRVLLEEGIDMIVILVGKEISVLNQVIDLSNYSRIVSKLFAIIPLELKKSVAATSAIMILESYGRVYWYDESRDIGDKKVINKVMKAARARTFERFAQR